VKRRLEGRGAVSSRRTTRISNHFTRRIAVWRALVGDTAAAVLRLASRDLSRGAFAAVDPRRAAE